ncbi:MAG: hypothetical protein R3293_25980 [Candidatus Promineifilaceae bacterium]|nr:hypothetical protein [Candidatus Promineifilaceae bacterium]
MNVFPTVFTDPTGHYVAAPNDGEIDRKIIVASYYESEANTPLVLPIVVDNRIIGRQYHMPVGAQQSIVSEESPQYTVGRLLAIAGIVSDMGEIFLAATAPAASILPGYGDGVITYASGMLTGDNYGLFPPPPPLPQNMISLNQDTVINAGEAFVPVVAAKALGISGILAGTVSPIPGDELFTGALIATYAAIDITTSVGSLAYDTQRFTGEYQNHYTVGYAVGHGLTIIIWP